MRLIIGITEELPGLKNVNGECLSKPSFHKTILSVIAAQAQ